VEVEGVGAMYDEVEGLPDNRRLKDGRGEAGVLGDRGGVTL
jgi:hypothetical protein